MKLFYSSCKVIMEMKIVIVNRNEIDFLLFVCGYVAWLLGRRVLGKLMNEFSILLVILLGSLGMFGI